jgi:hypothetical protein
MNFADKAIPLTRQGLMAALDLLELGQGGAAALWAVFEVETAGTTQGFGFRADRRPQLLFERHVFRKRSGGRFNGTHPDISGPQGGYGSIGRQYARLEQAMQACRGAEMDEELALQSASWGLGQVMGFNHDAAGYASAAAMVAAMVAGEDAQLAASARFMVKNQLDRAMRAQDWATFARIYNGPRYAENKYDLKLQVQYERFSSGSLPDLEVRTAQAALLLLGYAPGKIDGVLGERTRKAIRGFQIARGLAATGELSGDTYATLWDAAFA